MPSPHRKKILVTGASGFIGGYLVEKLLKEGHEVIGLDNYSKYGFVKKNHDKHPRYKLIKGDAKDAGLLKKLLRGCDHFVAGAAMIGGIGYFHKYAYDLLAENERITAAAFDAAIYAHTKYKLKKITVISSSMVYESALIFPTKEKDLMVTPAPKSTYGFQKLSCEYFAKGAWEQYGLPYTIIRPFNCVGIGEGNPKIAMSHVVPDLVYKVLKGEDPLHILGRGNQIRCYTHGTDIAEGIYLSLFSHKATNQDFNISARKTTTVLALAKLIWKKINPEKTFRYVSNKAYEYDVQKRIPDVGKAQKMLGFKARTNLDEMIDEIIAYQKTSTKLSIIIPVHFEEATIISVMEKIKSSVKVGHEIIVVYDLKKDPTVKVVADFIKRKGITNIRLVQNSVRTCRGVVNAFLTGIKQAKGQAVVVVMADMSDELEKIDPMVAIINQGADIVCASRYMRGGALIGGPVVKQSLSRMAGLAACWFFRLPTHDPTNAFKVFRKSIFKKIKVESDGGFEYNLEVVAKAWKMGYKIAEVPARWRDRRQGKSKFKLFRWMPKYLRWYFYLLK